MSARATMPWSNLCARLRPPLAGRPSTRLRGELPQRFEPGMRQLIRVELRNLAALPLRPDGGEPVQLGSRWFDEAGAYITDGPRARLGRSLWPRASHTLALMVAAPEAPGRYELRVAPVREHVAWFDDVDARNGLRASCEVAASDGSNPAGLPGLAAMIAQTETGPEIYRPSAFWEELCAFHVSHLRDEASFAPASRANVNGNPILPQWGPGPMEAVEQFLAQRDDFAPDRRCERLLLTMNPSGYLRRS